MVIIWLMMGNTNLLGGFNPTPLKNDGVRQIIFFPTEWNNKIHVPNHQPVMKF